jgi:NAD(P)H-dependent FMN reductase
MAMDLSSALARIVAHEKPARGALGALRAISTRPSFAVALPFVDEADTRGAAETVVEVRDAVASADGVLVGRAARG